nr:hypothetical protein [Allomuricauda sp.]
MKLLNDLYVPVVIVVVCTLAYSAYLSYDIKGRAKTPINKKED